MKDRPILFKGPMVRALLRGRKTQTRRIIKPYPLAFAERFEPCPFRGYGKIGQWAQMDMRERHICGLGKCPYGQPDDWLWVKETWRTVDSLDHVRPSNIRPGAPIEYAAGGNNLDGFWGEPLPGMGKWRRSIFMPKWMSRVILEIVSVRVERVNDISEKDAKSEGVLLSDWEMPGGEYPSTYREAFWHFWEHINGTGSWELNPWVWVIEFKEVTP